MNADNRKTKGKWYVHPKRGPNGGDIISSSPDATLATKWIAEFFTSSGNDTSAKDAHAVADMINDPYDRD